MKQSQDLRDFEGSPGSPLYSTTSGTDGKNKNAITKLFSPLGLGHTPVSTQRERERAKERKAKYSQPKGEAGVSQNHMTKMEARASERHTTATREAN